jgi:DNA-binding HxlR family transcriptional regulator
MPFKSLIEEPRCSVVRTLDIVGEKWSLLILRNALRGQTTFSQFRDQLGIPSDILTARLATLVEHGIFEKQTYRDAGNRERSSYHLTEAGRGLKVVIAAITQWGDTFNPSGWGASSLMVESDTREPVEIAFVDPLGERVAATAVSIIPGPGAVATW